MASKSDSSCLLALRDTKKYSTLNVKSIIIWKLCFDSLKKAVASKSTSHYYQYATDLLKNLCHKSRMCLSPVLCESSLELQAHIPERLVESFLCGHLSTSNSICSNQTAKYIIMANIIYHY